MKRLVINICLLVILSLSACSKKHQNTEVDLKVSKETLEKKITISGKVVPQRSTVIVPAFNGYVKKVYVSIGEQVKVGQPLILIVPSLQSAGDSYPLLAPFSGVITQVLKREGEYVATFSTGEAGNLLRIEDQSRFLVESEVPEMDITKTRLGQEVQIRPNPILDKNYKGIVREIQLTAKDQGQNWSQKSNVVYIARTEIIDADERIKSGMSVLGDIITDKKESVIALAHEYIKSENDKNFVIMPNGEKREVKIGLRTDEKVEITEGLKEGEQVQKAFSLQAR
jgi:multidrug efflux pump subunit AcrA (membrane-fusion protein)